ncbi:flagellar assembly protein FliH [Geomonas subterranea]|uniref:Flagellar assembly protein FliH n=1 Tax=Geomonas subterranea TaxID=2847989 RepID=A0ABX8LHQ3_9BACT|nr:FliH/SctL family protein [Geomonas subterranea]QXE90267.1 flagellar assembly protein FliH [Geomonas subterranea]QXM07608.1 flagellar assembly protein FliH [Geomonas subterranea]
MSSSKIIRKGFETEAYTLEPLGGVLVPSAGQEVFRPIQLGGEEPAPAEEEEEPEAPPAMIAEDEALKRIQQAHAEGMRKGRQQAEEDLAKVSEALAQALLSTGALRAQLMHDAEEDLLKLSVLIARKVMMREFSLDPGLVAGLVHGAVELAADEGEIVVRLNPEEYQVVAYSPQFQALSRDRKKITLREDPALGPASCLVETVRGNIDAGLDAQLDEIMRRLSEERNARREEEASGD